MAALNARLATRTGALSATIVGAICPTTDAPIRYQAGAMALPVNR